MKQSTLDLLENLISKTNFEDVDLFVGPMPHGESLYDERDEIAQFLTERFKRNFRFNELNNSVTSAILDNKIKSNQGIQSR